MEKEEYFEDYVVGETRQSLGRTITETDIVIHAGHSGDFYPHHIDKEFCATQPFEKPIAHGTMTFAIGVGLTAMQINPRAFTYGYERLRFLNPVYADDTIRTTATVGSKTDDPKCPEFPLKQGPPMAVLSDHRAFLLGTSIRKKTSLASESHPQFRLVEDRMSSRHQPHTDGSSNLEYG